MDLLKYHITWLAASGLLFLSQSSNGLFAEKKAKPVKASSLSSDALDSDSIIKEKISQVNTYLDKGYRIEQAIDILNLNLPLKSSEQKKITAKLFKLANTPVIHKKERLVILEYLFALAKKNKPDQKYFISEFIELSEEIKSPTLSDVLLKNTFDMLIHAGENERQISTLQSRIIEDIYAPQSKQDFTHRQHSITLRSLKDQDNDQNKRILLKLFEAMSEKSIPHAIRLEVFKVFNHLTMEKVDQNSFFSTLELKSCFVQLAKMLKSTQKALLQPEELRPEQLEEFKLQIAITENLLGNPKLNRNRQECLNPLLSLLNSSQPQVVHLAGTGLLNTKIIELEHRIQGVNLTPPLIQHAKKRNINTEVLQDMMDQAQQSQASSSQEHQSMAKILKSNRELQNIALELLSQYGAVLIRASFKEPQADLVTVFTYLKDQFLTIQSWEAKTICLSAFQNLDIDLIQSRYFPDPALRVLDQMFKECFDVLALESEEGKLGELKKNISEMLSNTTGAELGTYSKDWQAWRQGVLGKRFFAKL